MTAVLMDHDDEHAPVRHEITTIPCGQCGRAYLPGEMQALDNGRGDRWHRCYRCRASTEKRYAQATWDELRAAGLSESELRERSGAQ